MSLTAERIVIGSALLDRLAIANAAPLEPADFSHPCHGKLWRALVTLEARHEPIGPESVVAELRRAGDLEALRAVAGAPGGDLSDPPFVAYVAAFYGDAGGAEGVRYYAAQVLKAATLQRIAEAAQTLAANARQPGADPAVLLAEVERELFALVARAGGSSRTRKLKPLLAEMTARIEARSALKARVTGVATQLGAFDLVTTGLHPARLYLLAARPAMGKTALAVNVACAAGIAGVPVLVYSLEMDSADLVERMVAGAANLDTYRLATGELSQGEWVRLVRGASDLSGAPITFDDSAALTLPRIRSIARRWRAQDTDPKKPALIVFDYLQLVGHEGKRSDNREREIAEVSSGLKALSKELRCPVLALAQLNRDCDKRGDKRPLLSDLRESGAIEQDADVVCFLYRDSVYNPKAATDSAELIIGKNRHGKTAMVPLRFVAASTRFEGVS